MKFSENWLRQHVKTTASRDALAATLTAIGLEVEEMTVLGEALDGVVVARIVSAEKHPEADKLQVCQVDAGGDAPLQIVCGAPNARAGLVAPLATIGTKVGELTIKAARLRGVESNGMLCSAKELGIDADASGLLELPGDAPVGTPLADYLGLPDASIELKLTPNRADCFGVRGIAFDVAAATGSQVEPLDAAPVPASIAATVPVELNAGASAPRFVGRVIEGVDASAPTPLWMAERLRRSGVRPLSLLVDVTQYVMLELGQPMHAYDRDLLKGPIGVRQARAGESLVLLNGDEAKLDAQFLVITDADRVVGLAGIMGGNDTKVGDATRNVFLEAAHFAPAAIIGRSRKLGLHTDAGHRFERGVDPAFMVPGLEMATKLVMELCGGTPSENIVVGNAFGDDRIIDFPLDEVKRLAGIEVPLVEIRRILGHLGFTVAGSGSTSASASSGVRHICRGLFMYAVRCHRRVDRVSCWTQPSAAVNTAPLSDGHLRAEGGSGAKIGVIAYAAAFPILLNTIAATREVPPRLVEAAPARPDASASRLEEMVRGLAARVDANATPGASAEALDARAGEAEVAVQFVRFHVATQTGHGTLL